MGDVPMVFAGGFAAFVLFATWAAVQHWYRAVDHLDVLVHVLTPGHIRAVVLAVTLVGTGVAVVGVLRVNHEMSPQYMRVGYDDTVGDSLAGTVGSMLAGVLILWWLDRQTASSQWAGERARACGVRSHDSARRR